MKKILIIEDEKPAASWLVKLIKNLDSSNEIIEVLDSVEDGVKWFKNNPEPDLAFFDIELADGLSFKIFDQVQVECPIVFTTAYDQYAISAFKVNSIDYLLKPIDENELQKAWNKFKKIHDNNDAGLKNLVADFKKINQQKNFKERFLIKKGEQFTYLKTNEVAFFYSESSLSFVVDKHGKRFLLEDKLDLIEQRISPKYFFRINRKFIIRESAINKITSYLNKRLILELNPKTDIKVVVARERVNAFKAWLDR